MTTVTAEWLERREACERGIEIFRSEFGAWAALTAHNLRWAAVVGLDLDWLAETLPMRYDRLDAVRERIYPSRRELHRTTSRHDQYCGSFAPGWLAHQAAVAEALIAVLLPGSPASDFGEGPIGPVPALAEVA